MYRVDARLTRRADFADAPLTGEVVRAALASLSIMSSLAIPVSVSGQNSQTPAGSSFCIFRAAPAARCDRFLITEFAIHPRASVEGEGSASYLTWEAGMMFNKRNQAWGGTLFVGVDGIAGTRIGIRGRYRRWLGPSTSVDAAAGLLFMRFDGSWDPLYTPSLNGSATLNLTNWLGIGLTVEDVVYSDPETRHSLTVYPSVKFGGMPGLVTTALLFALAGVVVASGGIGGW